LVSLCLQGIEPNSVAETTSALLDVDTSHTKFNRESKMVPGVFKPLAKVSKLRIGKDLGLTEVSLGTKVIGYAVAAGVMRKIVRPQVQRFQKTWGGTERTPVWIPSQFVTVSIHTYLGESFSYDDCNHT
jgi:hypothetical protein